MKETENAFNSFIPSAFLNQSGKHTTKYINTNKNKWAEDRVRNLLGHFHYYSSVLKNAFDILKGLGVYKHIFLQCSKPKNNKIKNIFKISNCALRAI